MLVFFILMVLILCVALIVLARDGTKFFIGFLALTLALYSFLLGDNICEGEVPENSEKGYNVFPVYKVSGNDTISTTWYVRERNK